MINQISSVEREAIWNWIEKYGETVENGVETVPERRVPFETIFREWKDCKSAYLWSLLGKELILSKPIDITLSDKVMEHRAERQLVHHSFISEIFWTNFVYLNAPYPEGMKFPEHLTTRCRELVSAHHLITNEWSGPTFDIPTLDGKMIRVEKGTKIMRVLGKLAKAFNLPKFEEFRILQSQVVNDRVIKGDLCLSIHPLDFLTMSDNSCNWSSCMHFASLPSHRSSYQSAGGCYRIGTVEMMNSPYIIEAYVRDRTPIIMPNGLEWSNKKWRTLIFVDRDLITSIKSYPYQSSALSKVAVDWVRELATTNLNWHYEGDTATAWRYEQGLKAEGDRPFLIDMRTDRMYNDFGECTFHYGFLGSNIPDDSLSYNYSGARTCLWCGKTESGLNDEDELYGDFVICRRCSDAVPCFSCNVHIPVIVGTYVSRQCYCPHCLVKDTLIDCMTGERRAHHDYTRIFVD